MGEYITASIRFGGKLSVEKAPELLELIQEKRLDPDWGCGGGVELEDLRTNNFFASSQVNYGNLDELRDFAVENGLWYEYWCDSGPEWDAETVVYNPETGEAHDFVGGQTNAISKQKVKELGSYEAILDYFRVLDKASIPPLEIVTDTVVADDPSPEPEQA
jgi:hypothetical protein